MIILEILQWWAWGLLVLMIIFGVRALIRWGRK